MDPVLTASLLAAVTGAASAFIAYWSGVARTERRHRDREAELLDDLDDLTVLLTDMVARPHHPAGRHLRLVEEA